jgi:5-methylcytosine-specific restriction endonuclease McrA
MAKKHFAEAVAERDGFCLYGLAHQDGCFGRLHVHHIVYRGRGGEDEAGNCIALCAKHHNMVHRHEITTEELYRVRALYTSDREQMISDIRKKK